MAKPVVKRVKSDHLTLPFLEGGTRIDLVAQELNGERTVELSGDLSGEVQTSFKKDEKVSIPAEIKPGAVTQEKLGSDVVETIEKIKEDVDTLSLSNLDCKIDNIGSDRPTLRFFHINNRN